MKQKIKVGRCDFTCKGKQHGISDDMADILRDAFGDISDLDQRFTLQNVADGIEFVLLGKYAVKVKGKKNAKRRNR